MKKIQLAAFLVLTGAGFYQQSAQAFQASAGDLFIGFQSYGGNGVAQSYVIDVGSESLYTVGNGSSFPVATAYYGGASSLNTALTNMMANDISSGDGTTWYNTSDTYWGVGGGTAGTSETLYAGVPEKPTGTRSSAIATQTTGQQTAINGLFSNLISSYNQVAVVASTQAQIESTSQTNGWTSYNGSSAQSFTIGTQGIIDFNNVNGAQTVLDLYQIPAGGTSIYEGNFTISSTGLLTYNSATAVPEPSALTALAGGAGLLGLIRRRRAVVA